MTGIDELRHTGGENRAALARGLAALHQPRELFQLHDELAARLERTIDGIGFAVLLHGEAGDASVVAVRGSGCPLQPGDSARMDDWQRPRTQRLPIRYGEQVLGELQVTADLDAPRRETVETTLAHYAVALVNLTLSEGTRRSTELYYANLQAFEQGVVLFQEESPDTIKAGLLGLCTTMMEAPAGALFVLDDVGDRDSELILDAALGMPEEMLLTMQAATDNAWPRNLLGKPVRFLRRTEDPGMGGMDPETIPDVLHSMVTTTLDYHGVIAGLCILFNAPPPGESLARKMSSLTGLGRLGAAILHRLHLEEISRRNRALETQLQIASTIQSRLLPSAAPPSERLECAWRSQPAQYIGGDYLDLLDIGGAETAAVIADVSGHGVNSALLMSSFRAFYRAEAPLLAPHDLLAALNKEVTHEVGSTGMFITAAAFLVAGDGRSVRWAGAGHNPVLLYRHDRGVIERLASQGPPLGFIDGAGFACDDAPLSAGDVLVLYTDGVVEAVDDRGEMFGEQRLESCIVRTATATADAILDAVFNELARFTGADQQQDDVSVAIIKIR